MNFDFYALPEPKLLEIPKADAVLLELKKQLIKLDANLETKLVPQNPIYRLLEVFAYREIYYKTIINQRTRALFIRYATGTNLDNLAALFGIKRKVIKPEDKHKNIPAILEDDQAFRNRCIFSLNGLTNAGTPSAYRHHAINIDDSIKDAAAVNQGSGRVLVTLLSYTKEGEVNNEVVNKAIDKLNSDDIKPLCDLINVISAPINKYNLKVRVYFKTNVDAEAEIAKMQKLAREFHDEKFYLGKHIYISQIIKKLHLPSVEKLNVLEPNQDLISKPEEAFFLNKVEFDYAFV